MNNKIDITAPALKNEIGNLHIISKIIREIEDIFSRAGFEIAAGPEVEREFFNFDAINVPQNHPARDMQDTFFVEYPKQKEKIVLRTHTTNIQARYLAKHKPPLKIIAPGRVFRNEASDATHEAQFHQVEGLVVSENISLANLKAVLISFLREFFEDKNLKLRIRPGYFPFVEPGLEVDMTCHKCREDIKKSCNVCKGSGWIEIGGAGMVHPNILKYANLNPDKYQGFAFGLGIERMAMLKYGIADIRDFFDGDISFLRQF